MKRSLLSIFAVLAMMMPMTLSAQMTIEEFVEEEDSKRVQFVDTLQMQSVFMDYFSPALYRHQRKLVREERNDVTISGSLLGSLTNLSESWIETSGGDNSITLLAKLEFKHVFKKSRFSVTTDFSSKFGYYRVALDGTDDDGNETRDQVWFKNQDEFVLTVTPSYEMSANWSYGTSVKFRSQYAAGYVSSSSQESYNLKSDFLSPGYLDVSVGMIYKCPKESLPFTVSLSPLAMSAVYVRSDKVIYNSGYSYGNPESNSWSYVEPYGVSPSSHANYDGGFSVEVGFDKYFGKEKFLRYKTTWYSFYGWMTQVTSKNTYSNYSEYEAATEEWSVTEEGIKPMLSIHPTMRWENTVEIKATKLLTTTIDFQLYYNRAQNKKLQTQTLLSVGLAYSFNSK